MPAFTHLCQKFNISLAHNTITLYPKKTGEKGLAAVVDQCFNVIGIEFVDMEYELDPHAIYAFDAIGRPTFIHRDDIDHHLYHEDSFNMDSTHYHMKFARKLDEDTLDRIFSIFVNFDMVSIDEKHSFLDAYKKANVIEPKDLKNLHTAAVELSTKKQSVSVSVSKVSSEQHSVPVVSSTKKSSVNKDDSEQHSTPVVSSAQKKSERVSMPVLNEAEAKFIMELNLIKLKAEELREQANHNPKVYLKAATTAEKLYNDLNNAASTYFNNKNADTYRVFKDSCKRSIDNSLDVLQEHRGWKNVLCNIAAAIVGLGVFYLAAAAMNYYKTEGKHFFFQFNTDSVKKINDFQESVALAAPAA